MESDDADKKIFAAQLGKHIPELDLHGLHVQQALEQLELFLDRMCRNHENTARVIYGFGTGTLRAAALRYLSKNSLVVKFAEETGNCIVVIDI